MRGGRNEIYVVLSNLRIVSKVYNSITQYFKLLSEPDEVGLRRPSRPRAGAYRMWDQRDLSLVRLRQNTDERSRDMEARFGQRRIGIRTGEKRDGKEVTFCPTVGIFVCQGRWLTVAEMLFHDSLKPRV